MNEGSLSVQKMSHFRPYITMIVTHAKLIWVEAKEGANLPPFFFLLSG